MSNFSRFEEQGPIDPFGLDRDALYRQLPRHWSGAEQPFEVEPGSAPLAEPPLARPVAR
jgi:hypothetical protein